MQGGTEPERPQVAPAARLASNELDPTLPSGRSAARARAKPAPFAALESIAHGRPAIEEKAPPERAPQMPLSGAPLLANEGSPLHVTTNPSVSTVSKLIAPRGAKRIALVFTASLIATLSVFGGVTMAFRSARVATPASPMAGGESESAPPVSPKAPAASATAPPAQATAAGPAPEGILVGTPAMPQSSVPAGSASAPAVARVDAETQPAIVGAAPAGASIPQPRSKVSHQRNSVRPSTEPSKPRAASDLPSPPTPAVAASSGDEEPFGAAFLSRGRSTTAPSPTAAKPRPASGVPSWNRSAQ